MDIREIVELGIFFEELGQTLYLLFQLRMLELKEQDGDFYIMDSSCDHFVRISKKLYDYLKGVGK